MSEVLSPDGVRGEGFAAGSLCSPFMAELPISGALISIVDRSGHRSMVDATDPVAARWDELELELGIGPLHDAFNESAPLLVSDVSTPAINHLIGAPLHNLGVRALFTFPLTMGFATVGAVGVYRSSPGALTADSVSTALSLARTVTVPAVREALRRADENGESSATDTSPGLRREVHQATGMLSVRLAVTISEAFARLRAFAISSERSITAVSRDIIDGTIEARDFD